MIMVLTAWKALRRATVTGDEVLGKHGKNDVPGRHYAIGLAPPLAYCLPGRTFATV